MERMKKKPKSVMDDMLESLDGEGKRSKGEILEVTGVSRCGRVRKKSSKLMDFESPDEFDHKLKKKLNFDMQVFGGKKKIKLQNSRQDHPFVHHQDDAEYNGRESGSESEGYHHQDEEREEVGEAEDDDFDVEEDIHDDEPEEDDDDDEDYTEGQLVVDEKTPTQSLYMMEKSKKKMIIKNGKAINPPKAQRKDKGKARFTAYMMWAKEVRQELSKQYPDMDFTTMARRLSELWGTVPNTERELWRRKAKREAAKKPKVVKQDAPLMPSRKFINKRGAPVQRFHQSASAQPQITPRTQIVKPNRPQNPVIEQQVSPIARHTADAMNMSGLYKVTGTAPIDVAAHLALLGESLSIIGERLREHEGQIAVSGSLSVLLDSFLCAVGPLMCLTNEIEGLNPDKRLFTKTLNSVSYLMPGLG